MNRAEMYRRLHAQGGRWDIIVIGGGATGAGVAIDAASRGYATLLLEQSDFGKGTSSRSTKLIHGGVRYLEQGRLRLVRESLQERGLLLRNAPHLVHKLGFLAPGYRRGEAAFYGLGLKLYDRLAGKRSFGAPRILSRLETLRQAPGLNPDGLRGGALYFDGQFDDARLLIDMAATAGEQGAVLLNYARVAGFRRTRGGAVDGVLVRDMEDGREFEAAAKVVVNATGPFADEVRRQADPGARPMLAPSQGIHLVMDASFLGGGCAIVVPHTSDGRLLFAIPWQGHTLLGTTDTAVPEAALEPVAQEREIEFVLRTASRYLEKKPARGDITSVFAGIRPLVGAGDSRNTAQLSRDHTVRVEDSGILTICGGKWTTYRRMAEDCVNHAAALGRLPERPCRTGCLRIHGFQETADRPGPLAAYGSDAAAVHGLAEADPSLAERLHHALPYVGAEAVWAVREEMARTVEDVLARRTRALFLNARAATEMAPRVAALMAREMGRDEAWQAAQVGAFLRTARGFLVG